ncbi:MAG: PLP-dependent aminotransferase family protein [Bryobacteraceae bacterium]
MDRLARPIWYPKGDLADLFNLRLNTASDLPLYKQLAEAISGLIAHGSMQVGERLPATRELAGQLGLNRTTVSAAYAVLEEAGLIQGHVGRGSFVAKRENAVAAATTDWDAILPPMESGFGPSIHEAEISFATSRPAGDGFPLAQFRRLSKQVIDSPDAAEILQLGSPHGYSRLRRYLLEQATAAGTARAGDDLIITNGCQQGLDLLARLFVHDGESVVLEDPVYHGLVRIFSRAGANMIPIDLGEAGIDVDRLEEIFLQHRPRLAVLTPSFQNPTGITIPLEHRRRIVELTQRSGVILLENDIYSELRYQGTPLPTLKELDETGNTILLRSYSKVSFPGLRVGWVIAPRAVIECLAESKQISDLHSDQLSQAVLLRFAESGELAQHIERTQRAGRERLSAVLRACTAHLPRGTRFTRPEGGMSLWIELPAPLNAESVLSRAQEGGVTFLPGRYFSVRRTHTRGLRISFGGLPPEQITRGIQILGEAARRELTARAVSANFEPAAALV